MATHEQDAEQTLQQFGVQAQIPHIAQSGKWQPTGGNNVLKTNVHLTSMMKMEIYRYQVEISSPLRNGKSIVWSRRSKKDFESTDCREHCRQAFEYVCYYHADAIKSDCIYHDLQAILYSTEKLERTEFYVESASDYNGKVYAYKVSMQGTGTLSLNDFTTSVATNLDMCQRDLQHFIDIATSKYLFERPGEFVTFSANSVYLMEPSNFGFTDNDSENFPECGAYLAIGANKSTHIVEGRSKEPAAGLIIETKKTPFHILNEPLSDKIDGLAQTFHSGIPLSDHAFDKMNRFLKGMFIYTNHQEQKDEEGNLQRVRKEYVIKKLLRETPGQKSIEFKDAGSKTISKYFQDRYKINLKKPSYPLVEVHSIGGRKEDSMHLPVELCYICDNQRVTTAQVALVPAITSKVIRKCAVPPAQLQRQNDAITKAFNFDQGFLDPARMKVDIQAMTVKSSVLKPPALVCGPTEEQARVDTTRAACWSVRRYSRPGQIPPVRGQSLWVAYGLLDKRDQLRDGDFNRFLGDYVRAAADRGLVIGDPADRGIVTEQRQELLIQLEQGLRIAANNGARFAFIVHGDQGTTGDELHNYAKFLERRHQIITQCVRITTLRNYLQKNQRLTMENILNKTNIKLGGLNYGPNMRMIPQNLSELYTSTLFIGIAANYPGGGLGMKDENPEQFEGDIERGIPTVVGYAANYGKHNMSFVGDMIYQVARRDERVQIIRDILDRSLDRYKEVNSRFPTKVILYRSGFSEGNFKTILRYEVPLLQDCLEKKTGRSNLTIIMCNKVQNVRFFRQNIDRQAKAPEQNIEPGTVIDTGVVFPGIKEFFLNSHRTLQGTARVPKYTVLKDDNDLSYDQLENMTYQLCYFHEIVNSPTSLPSPIYIAKLYADRGRRVYQAYCNNASTGEVPTFEQLNEMLSYYQDPVLGHCRVNA